MKIVLKQTKPAEAGETFAATEFSLITGDQKIGKANIKAALINAKLDIDITLNGKNYSATDDRTFRPGIEEQKHFRPLFFYEEGKQIADVYQTSVRKSVFDSKTYVICDLNGEVYEIYSIQTDGKMISSIYTGAEQTAEIEHIHNSIDDPHIYEITYINEDALLASVFTALRSYITGYFIRERGKISLKAYYHSVYSKPEWPGKYDPEWHVTHSKN